MSDSKRPASGLPSHASPIISPHPRASLDYLHNLQWTEFDGSRPSTPGIPDNLISPAFTPPLTPSVPGTPSHHEIEHEHERRRTAEPKSVPVDTSLDDPKTTRQPRLLEILPEVECVVRARIPTTSGAEMFLHLYQNNVDNKEHLAIVFGNTIRSRSLDAERPGETEMDRMIRGAYAGRLRPGRVSSRLDEASKPQRPRRPVEGRQRSGSALKIVTVPGDETVESTADQSDIAPTPLTTIESRPEQEPASKSSDLAASSPSSQEQNGFDTLTDDSLATGKAPLVRIHSECYTGETAWSARCDCGEQLDEAARLMSLPANTPHPGGVIVYLRQEGRGIGLASKLKAYNLQDLGNDTVEANLLLRHPADARSYGLATSILMDLGLGTDSDVSKPESEQGITLLTNNPDKVRAVEGPARQVRVVGRMAMVPLAWKSGGIKGVQGAEIEKYLETKIGRMGHMLAR